MKSRVLLDYYFWKDALFEIDYSNYVKGQLATLFNANEERKVKVSIPFKYKKIGGYAKLDYTQLVYTDYNYNQANFIFSMYYKQFSLNSSTLLNWIDQKSPYLTSDLALSYRLKKGITIRETTQYNITQNTLMMFEVVIEKCFRNGYLTATYQRNVLSNDNYFCLSLNYDLPFARTNIAASQSQGKTNTYEGAQGSLAFDGGKYVHASNNSSVTRGGIALYPFLDMNNNGIFDKGERMVKLTNVKVMGGYALFSKKDLIVRIPELNSFVSYMVEFSDNDLENIAWRFKDKIYSVLIDPNQFKRVDIPVIVVGEASGTVSLNKDNALKGLGRIVIKFFKKNSNKVVAETMSESDGYIDYMGLEPGDYLACIDSAQLANLDFTVDPPCREFTIKTLEDGDVVQGIDFILKSKQTNAPDMQVPGSEEPKPEPSGQVAPQEQLPRILQETKTDSASMVEKSYQVQLAAARQPVPNRYFSKLLKAMPGLTINETLGADKYYRYTTGSFRNKSEAANLVNQIRSAGWKDCLVVPGSGK